MAMVSGKAANVGSSEITLMEGLLGGSGDEGTLGSCCGEQCTLWD